MTLLIDILLWALVVVLGLTLASRSQSLFLDSLRFAMREFMALLPRIALGMIGSGFIAEIIPQQWMLGWFGPGTGPWGMVIAAAAGALTPGGPVIGFALAATALKAGAGSPQVIVYVIAWALFALQRVIIYEIPAMPARVVWLRVVVSLPLPFLAAWMAMLAGRP
jgi:hypothetical protein